VIDTITFDLWNTLISNRPLDDQRYKQRRVEAIMAILKQAGLNSDFDSLARAYDKGFEKCKEIWDLNLDLSTEEQLKIMFDSLDAGQHTTISQDSTSRLVEAFVSPILDDPPAVIEGAKETLEKVKKQNYKVGLICNTGRTPGKTIRILLERLDLMSYFECASFSNEMRVRKPDSRIFLYTLSQLGSRPENSLHVGDTLELDVLGAKNAGMLSVHFNPDFVSSEQILPHFTIRRLPELNMVLSNLKSVQPT
jgi:putative hydrolase of the HAD superfamily